LLTRTTRLNPNALTRSFSAAAIASLFRLAQQISCGWRLLMQTNAIL